MKRNKLTETENVTKTKSFLSDIEEVVSYSELTNAVCFIKHKNGELSAITTDGNPEEIIGVIEVGKNLVYEDRFSSGKD